MRCDWRVLLAATGLLSAVANASKGDRDPLFRDCVARCVQTGCASLHQPAGRTRGQMCDTVCSGTKPAYLWHWSCEHDCAYHCMWIREELGATTGRTGERSMKYNGKWPFRRVAGLQELFSVVFSLGNLVAHVHMLRAFTRYMEAVCAGRWRRLYPYWWLWVLHSGVAANAWVWSALFHSRDLRWTERLDYVSAIAVVFTGLFTALCRALTPGWGWRAGALATCCFGGMAVHLRHMLAVRFDYGWNMKVCVAAALATCAAWLLWAWRTRHPARSTLTAAMLAVNLALLLELFDFPPLAGLLDAHALWHAATVPLVYVWYAFVFQDVQLLARSARDL